MPQGIKTEEPRKPTLSRRKEIIKTRKKKISEIENSKRTEENIKVSFYRKNNKIDKILAKLPKEKRKDSDKNNKEKEDFTFDIQKSKDHKRLH